jgi:Tfp pilus assembly protein PilF
LSQPRNLNARQTRAPQSIASRATKAQACCDLGHGSLEAGDLQNALWHLRHAVEIDGDCIAAWQLLGRCFAEMGEELRSRRCQTLALRLFMKQPSDGLSPIVVPRREPLDC